MEPCARIQTLITTRPQVGREIHGENLLLLRLPKHRQLLELKIQQRWGIEERIIGVAKVLQIRVEGEMLIGVEIKAEVNLVKVKFNPVEQACSGGAR